MKVVLQYFRESGKWYSEGEYNTDKKHLFDIWEEVLSMVRTKRLPGLVEDHSDYYVLIDVPQHPHRHPHLIVLKPYTGVNRVLDEALNSGDGTYKP